MRLPDDASPAREPGGPSRARMVAAASRLFRDRGFAGVSVADLMREAGLTHGSFYWHFASKDELKERAVDHAAQRALARWHDAARSQPQTPLSAWLGAYLSQIHREDRSAGCPLAALGAESVREEPQVRDALARAIASQLGSLHPLMRARSAAGRRHDAAFTLAAAVGALVLARAADDPLSDEILAAVRSRLDPIRRSPRA